MVELPLHHAYFLIPTGLIMGILEERHRAPVIFRSSRSQVFGLWFYCCLIFAGVARDYLRVDESFRAYRLEVNRVGNLPPGATPDVLFLTDLADFMRNARTPFDPTSLSEADLLELQRVVTSFPNIANMSRYAQALAFLRSPAETQLWLRKSEKMLPPSYVEGYRQAWDIASKQYPEVAAIPWPEENLR
jgi:hypothetical protein